MRCGQSDTRNPGRYLPTVTDFVLWKGTYTLGLLVVMGGLNTAASAHNALHLDLALSRERRQQAERLVALGHRVGRLGLRAADADDDEGVAEARLDVVAEGGDADDGSNIESPHHHTITSDTPKLHA